MMFPSHTSRFKNAEKRLLAQRSASANSRERRNKRNRSIPAKGARNGAAGFGAWWAGLDWGNVRFHMVSLFFVALWLGLWGRAGYLQLWEGPFLAEKAKRQQRFSELVQQPRGAILDRNGNILARSIEVESVYVNPSDLGDAIATAQTLSNILKKPVADIQQLLQKKRRFVWIARRVDDAAAQAVREANLDGVGLTQEYMRIYPYREAAGHLLGFTGIDGKGLEGLERVFDDDLTGLASRQTLRRDARGRTFVDVEAGTEYQASGAENIRLTIDLHVQAQVEEVLAKHVDSSGSRWGGVIVANTRSGEVLAWAQYPFFNPNAFNKYSPSEYRNRLALDALEPGSTMKPFVVATGLEEKLITKDTVFYCEKGVWRTGSSIIRDDNRSYEDLSVTDILSYSSNIGMAKIGLSLGPERIHSYLDKLGFGERSGLSMAESQGILRKPHEWTEVDTMSASFGQSVSTTALQMAQAYMVMANGGVMRPLRVVMEQKEEANERVFSKQVTDEVLTMMQKAVVEGTGKRAALQGILVAGKTGTAQKADKETGKYGDERTASFVGLMPADDPQYLVVVLLDEPGKVKYGGAIAAPVFRETTERVLAYYGELPDAVVVADNKKAKPQTPKVVQATSSKAVQGEVRHTLMNHPASDVKPGAVPDVVGKSVRRAVEIFAQQGLVPVIKGNGAHVVRQEPSAGKIWKQMEDSAECILWLSEN